MIKATVQKALNDQTRKEFYSHYLYLSMAAYFESINLRGFAHWMRIQAKEEEEHAMKFFEHIIERQGKVVLEVIDAPTAKWKTPMGLFEDAYNHERKVTESIHKIVDLAESEKYHATARRKFLKEKESAVQYRHAGALALYEGNVEGVKKALDKSAELSDRKYPKIREVPEKAVEVVRDYYAKALS